jgi:hypothetical protein
LREEQRKIFGLKREEDGSWRKLHNDELHSLYSSPNTVRVIKSRRMSWAGHVVPIPPSSAEVKECVELYPHSPIRLHGVGFSEAQGLYLYLYLYGGEEKCLQGFGWQARREETTGKT